MRHRIEMLTDQTMPTTITMKRNGLTYVRHGPVRTSPVVLYEWRPIEPEQKHQLTLFNP